jgi:hypothetical protein
MEIFMLAHGLYGSRGIIASSIEDSQLSRAGNMGFFKKPLSKLAECSLTSS